MKSKGGKPIAWAKRHVKDNMEYLDVTASKNEGEEWVRQYKQGFAWLEPLYTLDEAKRELLANDPEVIAMLDVVRAARAVITNPVWAGVSDEDVALERALKRLDSVLERELFLGVARSCLFCRDGIQLYKQGESND